MKTLFIVTDAWGGHGGIALFNRQFAEALDGEVTIIPRLVRSDVGDIPPNIDFVADAARGRFAFLRAVRSAMRTRPDLVICGHVNLLPFSGSRPLLITHGVEAWKPSRRPVTPLLLRRSRAIVSVSSVTRDRMLAWSHYSGPTFVLPNAIDLGRYGIRPRRTDLVERYRLAGKRVLLTVGRLVDRERAKGFDEVIEALPQLPPDVVYLIAGGGEGATRLEQLAARLGISDRVRFTGLFPEDEKPDIYNLADVYVMPSRGEGFGFVFLEAMACGLPVIGSREDGGREALLDGRLGQLVDPASREEIRAAILAALTMPRRVPEALTEFSLETFRVRVRTIVDAVTDGRSSINSPA